MRHDLRLYAVSLALVLCTGCGSLISALAGPPPVPPAGSSITAEEAPAVTAARAAARLDALAARVESVSSAVAAVGASIPGAGQLPGSLPSSR
jgi:hypothetical protein